MAQTKKSPKKTSAKIPSRKATRAKSIFEEELAAPVGKSGVSSKEEIPVTPKPARKRPSNPVTEAELGHPINKDVVAKINEVRRKHDSALKRAKTVVETELGTPVDKDVVSKVKKIRGAPKAVLIETRPSLGETKILAQEPQPKPTKKISKEEQGEILRSQKKTADPAAKEALKPVKNRWRKGGINAICFGAGKTLRNINSLLTVKGKS